MQSVEFGPIWRSIRRHRSFSLLVTEVAMGFFVLGNLEMAVRYFASQALPPSGHRETDLVEVTSRRPLQTGADGAAVDLRPAERAALLALPGVRTVAAVSSTQIDDHADMPTLFWTAPVPSASDGCPDVPRSAEGIVVGWDVVADAELARAVDLRPVTGIATPTTDDTAVVTRCLAAAVFGSGPAVGRTLFSNHHAPARVVGVIEDLRMHMALLYQTQLTAIYASGGPDGRPSRFLVRTEPGQAPAVRAAAALALASLGPVSYARDRVVTARLFSLADTHAADVARGSALILAVVGGTLGFVAILGNLAVAAFLVADRRRMIGVRRALGASRWGIFRYLLIENLIPTQLGNLVGLAVVLATVPAAKARFSGIQFGVADVIVTALVVSLSGVMGKLLPALRAARIPPSEVTRTL